jgi:hypothetical protein
MIETCSKYSFSIDRNKELNACIEYTKKVWDLSKITFKDKDEQGIPSDELLTFLFNSGLSFLKNEFPKHEPFFTMGQLKTNRIRYLINMGWDYDIVENDSIVFLFGRIDNLSYRYDCLIRELDPNKATWIDKENHLKEKTSSNYDAICQRFDNLETILPIGYDDFMIDYVDHKEDDNYDAHIQSDLFNGHSFFDSQSCYVEDLAMKYISYSDANHGLEPHKNLFNKIFWHGIDTNKYNNANELFKNISHIDFGQLFNNKRLTFDKSNYWMSLFDRVFKKSFENKFKPPTDKEVTDFNSNLKDLIKFSDFVKEQEKIDSKDLDDLLSNMV